jgi:hypothetical protein
MGDTLGARAQFVVVFVVMDEAVICHFLQFPMMSGLQPSGFFGGC